jgi:predicted GNAT superfamily acetyltransferase
VVIRDLDLDLDLDRIVEINAANVPAVGPADADHLSFLAGECRWALALDVVGDDGAAELAGFCLVLGPGSVYDSVNYTWFMARFDDAVYLDRVAFDARFQRRGLGSALYDEVEGRVAAERGVGRLTLEVNVDPPNEASLAFHAGRGYVEVGRQLSKGIEVALLAKPL